MTTCAGGKMVKEHTKKQIKLPESGQLEMLVKEIENSGSGFAKPAAELVQFWPMVVFAKAKQPTLHGQTVILSAGR